MADKKLSNEPTLDNSTIDTADLIYVADISASQTKGITNANLMSPKSSTFRVVDSSDLTKKVALNVSGLSTATTRTLTVPDANTTIVGTDTTQALLNKTMSTGTKINTSGSDAAGSLYYRDSSGNLVAFTGSSSQIVSFDGSGIPIAIPNPAASDASTTVKGVVEQATQAEVDAKSASGGTTAPLFVNPSNLRSTKANDGVADTGAANAYVITPSPAVTAYAAYQEFTFKATNSNTTASTLNVNGLGAKNILTTSLASLQPGSISAGSICKVTYDGTQFQLVSVASSSQASTVVFPTPVFGAFGKTTNSFTGNTTMFLALYRVTERIIVNKATISVSASSTTGTAAVTCYSYDGSTQLFSVTTASISAANPYTTAVPSIVLNPGLYWLGINAVSTTQATLNCWDLDTQLRGVTSQITVVGAYTIPANTPPSSIAISSISSGSIAPIIRLDQ